MTQTRATSISRRRFLTTTSAATLTMGIGPAVIIPGRAQPKTLKVLKLKEFIAGLDDWYDEFAATWSEQNGTLVMIDRIGQSDLHQQATREARALQGHDLIQFSWAPAEFDSQVIDHREIYQECERRYGKAHDIAIKSTYNPLTGKYSSFADGFIPHPVNYRKDLWDQVGRFPDSWNDVLSGSRRIKLLYDHPVGIPLAPVLDGNLFLRAVLYSFGGSEQDADGTPALKSKQTQEALQFVKALYEQAMPEDVLSWDETSNNLFMLSGEGSLTLNAVSITRAGENKQIPVTDSIWLAQTPAGPARRAGVPSVAFWTIWAFAQNIGLAEQFLVDLVGRYRDVFLKSGFFQFPTFPESVPNLAQLLGEDQKARPPDKYKVLSSVFDWNVNVGYPGYETPAIDEIFNSGLIPNMFAAAATSRMTPEEAMTQADQEVRKIFDKWQALGKI